MNIKDRRCYPFCRGCQCAEPLGESWSLYGLRWQLGHGRKELAHACKTVFRVGEKFELFHQASRSERLEQCRVDEKEGRPHVC